MVFEWLFGVGAVILGGGLAYGMVQSNRRNRRNDPITDKATRELYQSPEGYDNQRREELARQTH